MTVYYFLYLLIGVAYIAAYGTKRKEVSRRKIVCASCFFLIFLMFSLRHPSMGADLGYGSSYGYLAYFTKIADLSWREALVVPVVNYERGYILFNRLISLFSHDRQFFLACCAFAALFPLFYTIFRKSCYPMLSVLVMMGLPSFMIVFSGMRQAIAIGICFASILLIQNRQPIRFILSVFLAASFHSSAWVFLLAYPVYYFPMKKTWRVASMAGIPVIYVFRTQLFELLKVLFKENAVADNNGALTLFAVFTLIYVFTCLFSGEEKEVRGLKNLFFIACCIQALSGVYSTAMRVGYYFMTALILLLPLVLYRMHNRQNAVILQRMIGICFAAFGLYSLRTGSWAMSYPYHWFWT